MSDLDVNIQANWLAIADGSIFPNTEIATMVNISRTQFIKLIHCEASPQKETREKMVRVMNEIIKTQKVERHPSFGYALPEEIERLKILGLGPDRDAVLAKIAERTKNKGKTKK